MIGPDQLKAGQASEATAAGSTIWGGGRAVAHPPDEPRRLRGEIVHVGATYAFVKPRFVRIGVAGSFEWKRAERGPDVYVRQSDCDDLKLRIGDAIEFEQRPAPGGRTWACNVSLMTT